MRYYKSWKILGGGYTEAEGIGWTEASDNYEDTVIEEISQSIKEESKQAFLKMKQIVDNMEEVRKLIKQAEVKADKICKEYDLEIGDYSYILSLPLTDKEGEFYNEKTSEII